MRSALALLPLIACALPSTIIAHQSADDEDLPILCPNAVPSPDRYYVLLKSADRCTMKDGREVPGPGLIDCTVSAGAFSCEAWPKGQVTFTWSASPGLTLDSPGHTHSPYQSGVCSNPSMLSGSIYVTVTSPFGVSGFYQKAIRCSGGQEY